MIAGQAQLSGAYGISRWMRILELELCLLLDNSGGDGLIGEAKPSLLSTHQLPEHHSKGVDICCLHDGFIDPA